MSTVLNTRTDSRRLGNVIREAIKAEPSERKDKFTIVNIRQVPRLTHDLFKSWCGRHGKSQQEVLIALMKQMAREEAEHQQSRRKEHEKEISKEINW